MDAIRKAIEASREREKKATACCTCGSACFVDGNATRFYLSRSFDEEARFREALADLVKSIERLRYHDRMPLWIAGEMEIALARIEAILAGEKTP